MQRIGEIKKAFDDNFGTPTEALKSFRELVSGESGKRIEDMLTKMENLSKDASNLKNVIDLLKIVQELDKSGGLARLDSIMMNIPKGAESKALAGELDKLASVFGPKVDKLITLAETIMASDK